MPFLWLLLTLMVIFPYLISNFSLLSVVKVKMFEIKYLKNVSLVNHRTQKLTFIEYVFFLPDIVLGTLFT